MEEEEDEGKAKVPMEGKLLRVRGMEEDIE